MAQAIDVAVDGTNKGASVKLTPFGTMPLVVQLDVRGAWGVRRVS